MVMCSLAYPGSLLTIIMGPEKRAWFHVTGTKYVRALVSWPSLLMLGALGFCGNTDSVVILSVG